MGTTTDDKDSSPERGSTEPQTQCEAGPVREDVVETLLSSGQDLSARQWEWIAGLGKAAVPALVRVLRDPSLRPQDAPGDGLAPVHAAQLLAAVEAYEAIPDLLSTLEETDPIEVLYQDCVGALQQFGSSVIDPALEAYESARNEEYRLGLCDVMAGAGVRDERVFAVLLDTLDEDPVAAAMNLTDYGDARALPYLQEVLDAFEVETTNRFANDAVVELAAAIEQLGGKLTRAQHDKREHVAHIRRGSLPFLSESGRAASDAHDPKRDPDTGRKLGRNEPCWCGSGKKLKKCHAAPGAGAD